MSRKRYFKCIKPINKNKFSNQKTEICSHCGSIIYFCLSCGRKINHKGYCLDCNSKKKKT